MGSGAGKMRGLHSASPLSSRASESGQVAVKTEKGGDLGAQETLSSETKEELGAAMTMLPTPMGRGASAQSQ